MVTFYVVILQQRNLCYEYLLLLFFEEIENLITTTMHICAHILKMYMFIISFQATICEWNFVQFTSQPTDKS